MATRNNSFRYSLIHKSHHAAFIKQNDPNRHDQLTVHDKIISLFDDHKNKDVCK